MGHRPYNSKQVLKKCSSGKIRYVQARRSWEEFVRDFWLSVTKKENGCWEWERPKRSNGKSGKAVKYPLVFLGKKWFRIHRLSFELNKRKLMKGEHVLHTCDNTICVNPNHLRAGSAADNVRDCISKGRDRRPTKLTKEQVEEARRIYKYRDKKFSFVGLAQRYGVSKSCVESAVKGKVKVWAK